MNANVARCPFLAVTRLNAALLVVLLLVSGGCRQEVGCEGEFEYTAGMWAAEMTGVVENGRGSAGAPETGTGRKRLVVPSRLGGKRVRSVGAGAFRNTDAVSVKIPFRVSRIGAGAFAGCTNLLWAELPSRLERVEEGLFRGCSRMEVSEIPERVEGIGAHAYEGCRRLKRMVLPAKLRSVGEYAFSGCSSLESVELPEDLAEIREGAFEGCVALRSIRIPPGVTNIGERAFAGCKRLESVEVDEGNPVFCSRDGVLFRAGETEPAFHLYSSDPFYGLYAGREPDTVTFEGTVLAASAMPDPAENDYDHCLYAIQVEVHAILSGSPAGRGVDRTVLVNVPIMKDRVLLGQNAFEAGDKISCTCAEYDAMPQSIREIQLSDDILSYDLRPYYPLEIRRIPVFRKTWANLDGKKEITIPPIRSLPVDENAAAARRDRIRREIARIEDELERHGGSFEAWKEEYKPVAEKWSRLCTENHAGWTNDAYFAARGAETTYRTREYIEGILPYKTYLEENNIDLIVARVPSRWDFAARVLAADDFRENPAWVEHQFECLKNDIEIVDPMPEMWRRRFDFPLFYFYNDPGEYHPFEGFSFVSAEVIAEVLERYPYPKAESEIALEDVVFESPQPRYFWPPGNGKFDPAENLVFKQVVQGGGPIGGLVPGSGSPFLFLSSSYYWYPQRHLGASVPGYTAFFIQGLPDWFYQDGAHNPIFKNLVLNPDLLHSRRAVILAGEPGSWTGFPPLPKYIQDHAGRITRETILVPAAGEIEFRDHDSFVYGFNGEGGVFFESRGKPPEQRSDHFDMEFTVPHKEGARACMIRANIENTSYLMVDLLSGEDGTPIDTCSMIPARRHTADIFLPLAGKDTAVTLLFRLYHPEKGCTVKNIELWYY